MKSYSLYVARSFLIGLILLLATVVVFVGIVAVALVAFTLKLFAAGYAAFLGRKTGEPVYEDGQRRVIPGSFVVVREWRLEDDGS